MMEKVAKTERLMAPVLDSKKKGQDLRPDLVLRGGDDGIRTHDPHVANVMLSQLSYIPTICCAFAQDGILNLAVWFVNKAVMTPQFPREWGWRDGVGCFVARSPCDKAPGPVTLV